MKFFIYIPFCLLLMAACSKNSDLIVKEQPNQIDKDLLLLNTLTDQAIFQDYKITLPLYLRTLGVEPVPVENAKVLLGRALFYDKNLSKDRKISCASCHKQNQAFADVSTFSTGIDGNKTERNSPALGNAVSFSAHYRPLSGNFPKLMWDNRAVNVREQATMTFANNHEMGLAMSEVVKRINEQPFYELLFEQAFGDFQVDENEPLEALEAFVGAIGSYNSKLDKGLNKVTTSIDNQSSIDTVITVYYNVPSFSTVWKPGVPDFSKSEDDGRQIFVTKCTKCHSPLRPLQEVFEACNGLEMDYPDQGIGALTQNPAKNGVFKSPTLRNIELTAPYMHDGRFKTLAEVVDFYSTGIKNHSNLHELLKPNGGKMNFSDQDKTDLIAFMKTLTDYNFATDERYTSPYK
jgi:cytochrome c peroxidase